uniref:AlNc14C473G11844 protein n=1 Tax=Albugo laibachii Nc14 TaxID=890382 RepID=F0X0A7_9STRA|nr:AlNc14C473G11844 [Albugo laibachii Nc14]|eukprot:CCA27190.1 AlNc14C473G11844 [Albugo laibachii Nc14]
MIALPANAKHIFHPLDVTVFKPFKTIVRERLQLQMYETANPALSKQTAIKIACYAYRSAIIEHSSNAIEGVWGTGLYPLSLVQLHKRLGEYQAGGVKDDFGNASWLVRRPNVVATVQNATLTFPPACTQAEEA